MVDRMLLIAITPELYIKNEVEYITTILDNGFDYVHVRKPHSSIEEIISFIKSIPKQYYSRIKINGHQSIATEFNLNGYHMNSKTEASVLVDDRILISKSCHSIDEIKLYSSKYQYLFLSPIYDSISKQGYSAKFNLEELKTEIQDYSNIIALGGINASKLLELRETGFAGAAFLGYLFETTSIKELSDRIKLILENI